MAYLAFNETDGLAVAQPGRFPAPVSKTVAARDDMLTTLEWSVVRLARNDSRRSLRAPGRWSGLIRLLFGETNPRLADPRLEALRRLAVLVWHDGPLVCVDDSRALLDAGFTAAQLHAITAHIHVVRERDRGTVALL